MNEMIRNENSSYSKYEELLIRRDKVRKEAYQWERQFIKEFGDEILMVYEKKIDCIKLKKTISYCQRIKNHGGMIELDKLHKYLAGEMAEYKKQLDFMLQDNEASKKGKPLTEREVLEIKKIYRRLAKKMHPDMNPGIAENEAIADMWQRVMIAYNCNDLEGLKEAEVVINAEFKKLWDKAFTVEIPDLEEKIAAVQSEIKQITSTDPYMYQFMFDDDEAIKEKHKELAEEYHEYEEYEKQLEEMVSDYMKGGVKITWQMN